MTIRAARADGYSDQGARLYLGPEGEAQPEDRAEVERTPWWLLMWALTQLMFIALPEEYFYRGYVQTRLEDALGGSAPRDKRRGWRGVLSAPNVLTSALFALGHLLIPVGGALLPARASVFFPSLLFGALRERTQTIAASVFYHACCNMMVLALTVHYR